MTRKIQQNDYRRINDKYPGNVESQPIDKSPQNIRRRSISEKIPVKKIKPKTQKKIDDEEYNEKGERNLQLFCHIIAS